MVVSMSRTGPVVKQLEVPRISRISWKTGRIHIIAATLKVQLDYAPLNLSIFFSVKQKHAIDQAHSYGIWHQGQSRVSYSGSFSA
jgi:hypothetical protein